MNSIASFEMSEVFGPAYAAAYDSLYASKDYNAEAELLRRVFEQYGARPVRRVLDLGCGSGNHLAELSRAGFDVTGVDRSEAMLAEARKKNSIRHVPLFHSDLLDFRSSQRFDAVVMLFAVLGYQISDDAVNAAFATVRHHLLPGGLFVFDCWYRPAVEHLGLEQRSITVSSSFGPISRTAIGAVDPSDPRLCHVDFRLDPGGIHERHTVRAFDERELTCHAAAAGLRMLRVGAFPDFDRDPSALTWNVLAVACA